jgi:hypothetical protein
MIDLTGDSDDSDVELIEGPSKSTSPPTQNVKAEPARSAAPAAAAAGGSSTAPAAPAVLVGVKRERVDTAAALLPPVYHEDMEVVEGDAAAAAAEAFRPSKRTREGADDDELEVIGETGTLLPHNRMNCKEHAFTNYATHSKTCDLCFCYVCDKSWKECTRWIVHCHATDQGPSAPGWKMQREQQKRIAQNKLAGAGGAAAGAGGLAGAVLFAVPQEDTSGQLYYMVSATQRLTSLLCAVLIDGSLKLASYDTILV